jgi:hypothetical protein
LELLIGVQPRQPVVLAAVHPGSCAARLSLITKLAACCQGCLWHSKDRSNNTKIRFRPVYKSAGICSSKEPSPASEVICVQNSTTQHCVGASIKKNDDIISMQQPDCAALTKRRSESL